MSMEFQCLTTQAFNLVSSEKNTQQVKKARFLEKVSEYDQEIPQSHTADQKVSEYHQEISQSLRQQ